MNSPKILCLDIGALIGVHTQIQTRLPKTLEIIALEGYFWELSTPSKYMEEDYLLECISTSRTIPNLKIVAVPERWIDLTYTEVSDLGYRETWFTERETLGKLEIFTSGRVEMKTLKPRETGEWSFGGANVKRVKLIFNHLPSFFQVGDRSKGEGCLSTQVPVSPFQRLKEIAFFWKGWVVQKGVE